VIVGWPAGEIAKLVRRDSRDALEDYDPTSRALLEASLQSLEAAAAGWREWRRTLTARSGDSGNAATTSAAVDVASQADAELTPSAAAEVLGVRERQLRNLRAAGELPEPRKEGRRCWYGAGAVYELRDRRQSDG
jgi:hypothetical protein